MCATSQEIRKFQLPMLMQGKSQRQITCFRHTNHIVKDRPASNGSHVAASGVSDGRGVSIPGSGHCKAHVSSEPEATSSHCTLLPGKEVTGAAGGAAAAAEDPSVSQAVRTPSSSTAPKHKGKSTTGEKGRHVQRNLSQSRKQ